METRKKVMAIGSRGFCNNYKKLRRCKQFYQEV